MPKGGAGGATDAPSGSRGDGDALVFVSLLRLVCDVSAHISLGSGLDWLACHAPRRPLGDEQRARLLELYILGWLALLIGLTAFGPVSGFWSGFWAAVALYRLQDLFLATLDDALSLTERSQRFQSFDRSGRLAVVAAIVNVFQIILIFTLTCAGLAGPVQGAFSSGGTLSGRFDYVYVVWTNFFTLGSGHPPLAQTARALTMAETAVGLAFVALALATFISRRPRGRETEAAALVSAASEQPACPGPLR